LLGWLQTVIILISASQVAMIIGVSRQHPAQASLNLAVCSSGKSSELLTGPCMPLSCGLLSKHFLISIMGKLKQLKAY
jgi:hypothetical protein